MGGTPCRRHLPLCRLCHCFACCMQDQNGTMAGPSRYLLHTHQSLMATTGEMCTTHNSPKVALHMCTDSDQTTAFSSSQSTAGSHSVKMALTESRRPGSVSCRDDMMRNSCAAAWQASELTLRCWLLSWNWPNIWFSRAAGRPCIQQQPVTRAIADRLCLHLAAAAFCGVMKFYLSDFMYTCLCKRPARQAVDKPTAEQTYR